MNGKLDFPCLQILKLIVLKASKAPPKRIPLLKVAGFLEKIKPTMPPVKMRPPVMRIIKVLTNHNNKVAARIINTTEIINYKRDRNIVEMFPVIWNSLFMLVDIFLKNKRIHLIYVTSSIYLSQKQ